MSQRIVLKLLAAVVGAMSIAAVLLAVAILTRSVDGLGSSLAALNWIVPIAAGFLVGGVAWALLATGDRAAVARPPSSAPRAARISSTAGASARTAATSSVKVVEWSKSR